MERDLKEAASALRSEEYRWAVEKARDVVDLRRLERRLMMDSRISANERGQLFATATRKRMMAKFPFRSLGETRR